MQGGPLRKLVVLALVVGVIAAVAKALRGDPAPQFATHPSVTGGPRPEPTPSPAASVPAAATATSASSESDGDNSAADSARWVDPVEGNCPDGYPVKGKLSSGIFHVPGGLAYDRTKPDRCYADAAAAEADGLRASKR